MSATNIRPPFDSTAINIGML